MPGSCEVCSSEPSKYRCPICELMSCSLACTQSHKIYCAPKAPSNEESSNPPEADQSQNGDIKTENAPPAESKRPMNVAAVATSAEIKQLLEKHPELRSQLQEMYQATLEEEWVEWHTTPARGRGRGRGRGGSTRRSRGSWTSEKGFNRGLGKVRKLRQDCEEGTETGQVAEAFMRFMALVNQAQEAHSA
ncbi:hypothetical protein PENANT_c013G05407 [Penicillium antarcticum]|uniref:HIT-type domain-containing protein n=1 Tax=Penicillium antarcticum TaxID=416450 RepID=A0A1V6Q4R9_9EURO|nr:uncharacterized protein N7508_004171 [Penicillium antarcticum]KAJ5308792.1 hypothetical protein N7508_004171 [Penicillium antarcticum]OQD84243.1 hypothetical protein PENANT_c013G05407 [Penicillium antarcticum]